MEYRLDTDEAQDALFSLEVTVEHLAKVANDIRHWKWVIVALHNALQGFMVLALRGSDAFNVMTDKSLKEWWEAVIRDDPTIPPAKMDYFMGLFKKIQDPAMMWEWPHQLDGFGMHLGGKAFVPYGAQSESVEKLHFFRNEFIHFFPKYWTIGVTGLPQLVEDCMRIIHFLVFYSRNIRWHNESLEGKAGDLIEQVRSQNEEIAAQYGVDLRSSQDPS